MNVQKACFLHIHVFYYSKTLGLSEEAKVYTTISTMFHKIRTIAKIKVLAMF